MSALRQDQGGKGGSRRGIGGFRGLVLAAGKGTRFPSDAGADIPKVLRSILGRPMVEYVLDALAGAGVESIAVVVGHGADEVERALGDRVRFALQDEQLGSGHAVVCAKGLFGDFAGHLVVMCGDSPLFRAETLRRMMREHLRAGAAVTLAVAEIDDPTGYGRIVRGKSGRIVEIVEEKCATPDQRAIRQINGGAYIFYAPWLFANIDAVRVNETGEYNLTDVVRAAGEQRRTVASVICEPTEILGVNTAEDLQAAEKVLGTR